MSNTIIIAQSAKKSIHAPMIVRLTQRRMAGLLIQLVFITEAYRMLPVRGAGKNSHDRARWLRKDGVNLCQLPESTEQPCRMMNGWSGLPGRLKEKQNEIHLLPNGIRRRRQPYAKT